MGDASSDKQGCTAWLLVPEEFRGLGRSRLLVLGMAGSCLVGLAMTCSFGTVACSVTNSMLKVHQSTCRMFLAGATDEEDCAKNEKPSHSGQKARQALSACQRHFVGWACSWALERRPGSRTPATRTGYSPRYVHRAEAVSCTTISQRPGQTGAIFFQSQIATCSKVGFSKPSMSLRQE